MSKKLSRREFLMLAGSLGLSLYAAEYLFNDNLIYTGTEAFAAGNSTLTYVKGKSPAQMTREAINKMGGMKRFISKGDIVMLKPNIAWDKAPGYGANTSPEVVATVAKMCVEAGAKKIKIVDNTCVDPKISYKISGMISMAKSIGADIHYIDDRKFKSVKISGNKMKNWPVYTEIIEADKLINIPIAKHHGLSKLSLGMKNWFGAIGGERGELHQNIHIVIADLATYFKPDLTIVDVTKVLVDNGPQGGQLSDVRAFNTIIASTDPVAADAFSASFFGYKPTDIGYIKLAGQYGVGEINYKKFINAKTK